MVPGASTVERANLARVRAILVAMHGHAFNPNAPAGKTGGPPDGLFINWAPTWDGQSEVADLTDIGTDGLSDATAGRPPCHDPLADVGKRFANPIWLPAGRSAALQRVSRAADPATGLFPLQLQHVNGTRDMVVQGNVGRRKLIASGTLS